LPCSGPETADSHGTDSGHQDALKCLQENPPIIPVTFPEEQDIEGIVKYRDNIEGASYLRQSQLFAFGACNFFYLDILVVKRLSSPCG